jgi:hypothetical protein
MDETIRHLVSPTDRTELDSMPLLLPIREVLDSNSARKDYTNRGSTSFSYHTKQMTDSLH